MKHILPLLALFACSLTASAEYIDQNIGGINYTLDTDGKTATVISSEPKYEGDIVIPETVPYENEDYTVTRIGDYAFYECNSLSTIEIPSTITEIGYGAFYGCNKLSEVCISDPSAWCKINFNGWATYPLQIDYSKLKIKGNPESVVLDNTVISIPQFAFRGADFKEILIPSSVTSIDIHAFRDCQSLESVKIPNSVTSIGECAFYNCSTLSNIEISNSVTSIGACAFLGCTSLESIEFPTSVTYIGGDVVPTESSMSITLNNPTPVDYVFRDNKVFFVPSESVEAYKAAWPEHATEILAIGTKTDFDVTVEARENSSDVMDQVNNEAGEFDAMLNVVSLKVNGTINSYDIMTMRNKMKNLRHLDLSNARIVANSYQYYEGSSTQDDILGDNAFRDLRKLCSVKLPKVKALGGCVFENCINIKEIVIPEGVKSIGNQCFYSCTKLKSIKFSPDLVTIGGYAFGVCIALKNLELPQTIKFIGRYAFNGCSSLTDIMIPISIESIGGSAFVGCNIKDIWTWSVKPTNIGQDTFPSNIFATAKLHVPNFSKKYYYWDTQWGQFEYFEEFSGEYPFFKTQGDFILNEEDGRIMGVTDDQGNVSNPDTDMDCGTGFVVNGDEAQGLGDVTINSNGSDAASIIGSNSDTSGTGANINVDNLTININISAGRWYFFAFPFDIPFSNIEFDGQYVWRYYDGAFRAEHGSGAWKEATDPLVAGRGYIFQASKGGTLTLNIGAVNLDGQDIMVELESYASSNAANASWNLIGNPFTSYYELADLGFDAPITMWNGYGYEAYSPNDDDFTIHPFQAFFAQKPAEADGIGFDGDYRETMCQSQDPDHHHNAQRRRMARAHSATPRYLINLEITDGVNTDKSRVVFNEAKSMAYEMGCDASKFLSTQIAQIYSLDNAGNLYAINERPEGDGIVRLGIYAPCNGTYTISATRMDCEMEIVDLKTGEAKALSEGFTFTANQGTDNDRFILRSANSNGISGVETEAEGEAVNIGIKGIVYGSDKSAPNGVTIRRTGNAVEKVVKF